MEPQGEKTTSAGNKSSVNSDPSSTQPCTQSGSADEPLVDESSIEREDSSILYATCTPEVDPSLPSSSTTHSSHGSVHHVLPNSSCGDGRILEETGGRTTKNVDGHKMENIEKHKMENMDGRRVEKVDGNKLECVGGRTMEKIEGCISENSGVCVVQEVGSGMGGVEVAEQGSVSALADVITVQPQGRGAKRRGKRGWRKRKGREGEEEEEGKEVREEEEKKEREGEAEEEEGKKGKEVEEEGEGKEREGEGRKEEREKGKEVEEKEKEKILQEEGEKGKEVEEKEKEKILQVERGGSGVAKESTPGVSNASQVESSDSMPTSASPDRPALSETDIFFPKERFVFQVLFSLCLCILKLCFPGTELYRRVHMNPERIRIRLIQLPTNSD